ncbi:MAG: hypothetical protein GX234_03725 [Clostridiales bacterium]|nr:hypothetical protein [Clostridiales bacterium]
MYRRQKNYRKSAALAAGIAAVLFQMGCARQAEGLVLENGAVLEEERIVSAAEETASGDQERTEEADVKAGIEKTYESERYIYVHICGEVENPGVYRMYEGSRIYQAIECAGGMKPEAAEDAVNQALIVQDGMMVRIPSREEVKQSGVPEQFGVLKDAGTAAVASDGRININTATESELCTLSGIGESRAKSIIQYRTEHGSFGKIEDIMKVDGIKSGAFAKIRDEIVVE